MERPDLRALGEEGGSNLALVSVWKGRRDKSVLKDSWVLALGDGMVRR